MNQPAMRRMLAVDLRSSRLGFAVFEESIHLLDWGKRGMSADACSAVISQLVRKYGVSFVVIRGVNRGERRDTARVRSGLRAVRTVARRHAVPVVVLSEKKLRKFFSEYDSYTRYGIALFLTIIFPDLASILPRPRKCFEFENRRMSIFDAVALAVAFLGTAADGEPVRTLLASAAGVFSPASR